MFRVLQHACSLAKNPEIAGSRLPDGCHQPLRLWNKRRGPNARRLRHTARSTERRGAARRAGGKVHLVGHSFGGTVALAALSKSRACRSSRPIRLLCFERNETDHSMRRPRRLAVNSRPRSMTGTLTQGDSLSTLGRRRYVCRDAGALQELVPRNGVRERPGLANRFGFDAVTSHYAAQNVPVLLVRGALANPGWSP